MTLTKAKAVASALLDLGLTPEIARDGGGSYTVAVTKPDGATTAQVAGLESAQGVTARIVRAEFD